MKNIDRKSYVCNNINVMNVISRFCRAVSAASYPALWCVSPSYKQGHKARNKKFRGCCEGIWTKKLIENINSGKKLKILSGVYAFCFIYTWWYFWSNLWILSVGFITAPIVRSWFRESMIRARNLLMSALTKYSLSSTAGGRYVRLVVTTLSRYPFL